MEIHRREFLKKSGLVAFQDLFPQVFQPLEHSTGVNLSIVIHLLLRMQRFSAWTLP